MSVKDLQVEFTSLKSEFSDLQSKIDTLVNKYDNLEKKYEKCLSKKKKASFKCHKCGEKCENLTDLKDHKKQSCVGKHKCEEYEKTFREEIQLNEHMNTHKKFPCDECDKVYEYEGILEKHKYAVHGDFKLYCHFYNNNKDCEYDDQCIYLHEESEECKFGKSCERLMCMFRHDEVEESDDEDESDDDEEVDNDMEEDEESIKELKPVLKKIQEAVDKFEVMLKKCSLKCDHYEFEARNTNGLTMHMKAKHKKQ